MSFMSFCLKINMSFLSFCLKNNMSFMSFCLNKKGLLSCLSLLSNNTTCRKLVNYLRIWKIRCNFATANCGTMY